ncbi:substrate-binding domain-containing protein [Nodosilinea sp. PGN35]|uniref:substrate-binding domain-containing protein n=1 Tax=Nodosilinea sp. PGN35 TaxID=3020489 RepID=UPI0023B2ECCD|nr:substrate-binding domain-containing protein [Nodosilinea sp. TSF1-S3]MDF0366927.1 substrate-binding domain-containing protein [Nodosilinea sp. TSF1-S3]
MAIQFLRLAPPQAVFVARAVALALTTAAIAAIAADRLLAEAPAPLPGAVSIPTELPAETVLRLDGSSSMAIANADWRDRFLERFPNASVELGASRTDTALRALIEGDLDIVAAGRPLSAAERSQGLVELPIEREKIAIIVGPDNPFDGSLSFDQFARLFRGEIGSWAEVGGTSAPVRVVDRPAHSDTRMALRRYAAFEGAAFGTGSTADPVEDDDTEAVIDALGADGIGYAVASQVLGRSDVRILAMHGTLPEDPRYPYSQHRAYVYNAANPTPASLAFLGLVLNGPAQADVQALAPPETAPETAPETPSPAAIATPILSPAPAAPEAAPVPQANPAIDTAPVRRFPWWLLGIPAVGGLLWWLLKGKRPPVASPTADPWADAVKAPRLSPKIVEPARLNPKAVVSRPGAIQTVTVHSRHNAVLLSGDQMQYLQDQVAATYSLDPGSYILRIRAGGFNYGDNTQPGEPWVLLWIYGGQVSNLKTGVWVNSTWSTLNGYGDTLSLEVDEPAQLCAFFMDTFPENNTNALTLSVIRL